MGYINNKTFKIIDTIIWVLATIGMIGLLASYIELARIKKELKEYQTELSKR